MFLRSMLLGITMFFGAVHWVHADGRGSGSHFQISDAGSVHEAVSEVVLVLERQGFDVVAIIDHAMAAASVGLKLPPTQVIMFRKPSMDIGLIRRSQTTAIDLPLKILIFEDVDRSIEHKYNGPGYLVDRHDIPVRDHRLSAIDRAVGQFGAQDVGLISIPGSRSVPDTVAVLTEVLANAEFGIPFTIDYAADARRHLRDTTLIVFGNPDVGTQLMQNAREVALDLPQKFLVWEDRHHQTWITYNDPAFIARRGGVQGLEMLLGNIAGALASFARQGAGDVP